MTEVLVFDPKKGKKVKAGEIIDTPSGLTFVKKVNRAKHFFRNYAGYAISAELITELKKQGVAWVRVVDGKNTWLGASLERWDMTGHKINMGHGIQVVLPESIMTRHDERQKELGI